MDTILAILVTSFRNMLRQNHCHKITECRQVLYLHILRFWKEYNDINYIKKNLKVDAISQDRCILQSITYNCADKWWRFRTCRWGAFNNNSISHRQLTRVWRVTKKRRWLSMICRFDSFFLTLERTWMNEWMNEGMHGERALFADLLSSDRTGNWWHHSNRSNRARMFHIPRPSGWPSADLSPAYRT